MSGSMESGAPGRCRVCLQYQHDILQLDNVVTVQDEKVSLSHILVSCCAVEILNDDKKPQTVCIQCAQDAENSFKFKRTVEQADLTLQYELENMMDVKKEKIDEDITIEEDHETATMVLIKDELTDGVPIAYNNDLNLKFEQDTITMEENVFKISQTCFADSKSSERTYLGEKPYECSHCSKRFTSQRHLTVHMRIHTGEKPHGSSHCNKGLNQKYHLIKHERIHTGEKPYECLLCNKRFGRASNLNRHKLTHSGEKPYECSDCSKHFTTQRHLTVHMRIHTGEKPYGCSQCNKRFTQVHHLNEHELIHTGEKPYACSHCNTRFRRVSNLNRHKLTHSSEKPY